MMISKSFSTSFINNTHGANESACWSAAIRCSVHFQWNGPTLSPEHVTCKPFSDTPNPYGMRRRNKGTYESYNTNNGENHCILARKVKWFRELVSWFARSGMCCMIRAASINHYPFSGLRGWDLGARRRSVKKSRPLPFARRVRDGIGVAQRRAEIGHRLGAGVSVPDTANASPIRASRARRTICARLRCRMPSLLGTQCLCGRQHCERKSLMHYRLLQSFSSTR